MSDTPKKTAKASSAKASSANGTTDKASADKASAAKASADKASSDTPPSAKPAPKKWKRWLLRTAVAIPVLIAVLWVAVHNIPGFGPMFANGLRAVFGKTFVAWLEDTVYTAADLVNQKTKAGDAPVTVWTVPTTSPSSVPAPVASGAASGAAKVPARPAFTREKLEPMFDNMVTRGDGVWLPLVDPRKPDDQTRMLKTFVHPDKNRGWAVVAIVAVDLSAVELHSVVGRHEPERKTKEAKAYTKRAVVPDEHRGQLMAAFNGGYKSTHGAYGMKVDNIVFQPPRARCCVVARLEDGTYLIRDWDKIKERESEMVWWRQTPICMYDEGKPHPALASKKMKWGAATVSATTVIRRSAIGLNEDRTVLFVGIGDAVTGHAIGTAMHHAGAHFVSQLDVNFSFPKFLLYDHKEPGSDDLKAVPLTEHFEFTEDQYLGNQSARDFFYLTRREG